MLSPPRLAAALIAIAALLFVVGAAVERGDRSEPPGEAVPAHTESAHAESAAEAGHGGHEGRVLGVDAEGAVPVALAAIGSLLLAAAVVHRSASTRLLALVALAMLAFAALDVREVLRQVDEDNAGLAILAAGIALLHAAAAVTLGRAAGGALNPPAAGRPARPA